MQIKGAIRLLAIALAIVCFYQLYFTIISTKTEKKAREYAQGDIDKESRYLDSVRSEPVYNFLFGLKKFTYREVKEREINRGLDLKGGMNVILEISVEDLIRSLSNYSQDTIFTKAIRLAKKKQESSQADFLELFAESFTEIDPNAKLASIFNTLELRGKVDYNSTNEDVIKVLRAETHSAIDNAFEILRTRIDHFGVVQPKVQRLETTGRILVELPGVKDPERVRKLLQGTANLEFWETYENQEVYGFLLEANEKIKEIESAKKELMKDSLEEAKGITTEEKVETTEEEEVPDLLAQIEESDTADEALSLLEQIEGDTSITDSLAATRNIAEEYPLFAVLNPHVNNQGQLLQGSEIGYAHYRDTVKVNYYLNLKQIRSIFPRDIKFLWELKPIKIPNSNKFTDFYYLHAIKVTGRDGRPALDGDAVVNARGDFGQNRATAEVDMSMNAEGAKTWARITRENINRRIAIVLDNYVVSSPVVNQEIRGGQSQITGNFTIDEAKDLANKLKSGKLPAPARIVQEAVVGPTLGKEAINAGWQSFLIAFVIVLLYMIFYYNQAGLVANIALISNIFFIMGILASLGAVLTLPGIAGIILTVGMSVDANVLIYERIREEVKSGKGLKLAVSDGYKNAYSAIIDANVTTILTGIILYLFGTGPIKGFATTLIIGIVTSLFSAIFITRLIFASMLDKNRKITFNTKITENAFVNANINFLGWRKIFYVISSAIIIISIASLFTRGLNLGVDFTGGRNYVIRFDQNISTVEVQNLLKEELNETPEVIIFGQENQVRIATKYKINESGTEVDNEIEAKIYNALKPLLGENVTLEEFLENNRESSQKVGPTIADDIKKQAVLAIIFALFIIFIYIILRFRNWQYGFGAVVALIHDSLIVLGVFSLFYGKMPFSLEIDQAFIAAILTVVGYSINDTVIIFDRIREYVGAYPKRERKEIINMALNSTLSRTFSTSFSTFIVLLAIFIFGGEVIRGFTFALLVGIIVGTYSSLFIATPILYDTVKSVTARLKGIRR
ncbi:MAG: protein translocase subunit SecDF [Bacteroidales bacterium]|nr:protein translocase subunit SecDF [Bacteroidales bacterium]